MSAPAMAVRSVLSRYATFSGRATRSEFWWWVLAVFVLLSVTRMIDGVLIAPMLGLIPVVGTLILLYFYIQPSDQEQNQFGAPEPFGAV